MPEERSLSPSTDTDPWRAEFRERFDGLRAQVNLHPAESTASATFEAAARAARTIAADCLPLGIAVVMHLYPLCVLRCVPLPWWSAANLRRIKLLRAIDSGSLIVANAGSERAAGAHAPVRLTPVRDCVHVDGTFEYVSLSHVADVVLFSAPLAGTDCTAFCAADLRAPSVSIGSAKFAGSMQLADTCPVTFENHRVPSEQYLVVPGDAALQCMADYQRSWFQLLLGEGYLARIAWLQRRWNLPRPTELIASLNELSLLKEYSLRLLDEAASPRAVESLSRVTAAMKLRVSWLSQFTASAVRACDETAANELGYCRLQPTSDDRVVRSLEAAA